MDFLRDPLWQFIISVCVTVLFGILSIVFFLVQLNTKRLIYEIISSTPILGSREEFRGKTQFLYDGNPVKNATLVTIKLQNYGKEPIRLEDYGDPIKFFFNNAEVIGARLTEIVPNNLKVPLECYTTNVFVGPVLLNSKEWFTFDVLLREFDGEVSVYERIAGVKMQNANEALITQLPSLLKKSAISSAIASMIVYITYTILVIAHVAFRGPGADRLQPTYLSPAYLPITIFLTYVCVFLLSILFFRFQFPENREPSH